jgi:predicted dehydrogenase
MLAVADPDPTGREAAVGRTGAARSYADYREMLQRERPDVVAVAPWFLDQREPMVTAAAEAGARAIYCEKPVAGSLEEADRMLAACDVRGTKLAVAHQNRAFPAPRGALDLVRAGKIGRLRAMRAFTKQDERGGGLEHLVHGTHLFDLMQLFAGAPRWCHARVTQDGRDATPADIRDDSAVGPLAGDDIVAHYGFDGGVVGSIESMRSDEGGGNPYFQLQLCGTSGVLVFWSSLTSPVMAYPRPFILPDRPADWEVIQPEVEPVPTGVSTLHVANQLLAQDLLAAVEADREPVASGRTARTALEMIHAAYASHLAASRVSLPLAERRHPLRSNDPDRSPVQLGEPASTPTRSP